MTEQSTFSVDSSGLATVNGPLTLDTVTAVFNQADASIRNGHRFSALDLSAVPHVDSSGLALILEWQAMAQQHGESLSVNNAPADLLSLAKLCEANDLLTIEGRQDVAATDALL